MTDLERSKSFRTTEEMYEELNQLDEFSDIFRSMAELYLEEPFFRNGVDTYRNRDVDSFEEYAEAYFEARAEETAPELVEELDRNVDPQEIIRPLSHYLGAINFGDREWAEQAAEDFYNIDEELGDFFTAYTEKFSESQWNTGLE
ncbi:MAG: hypothetical protein ABEK00_02855 [Candidatus Nanohaloarchaea archaeon]